MAQVGTVSHDGQGRLGFLKCFPPYSRGIRRRWPRGIERGFILGFVEETPSPRQPKWANNSNRDQEEQPAPRRRPGEAEPPERDGEAQVIAHGSIAVFECLYEAGGDHGK